MLIFWLSIVFAALAPGWSAGSEALRREVGPWTLVCDVGQTECALAQSVADDIDSGQLWMKLVIRRDHAGFRLTILTPPGTKHALRTQIDGVGVALVTFEACDSRQCAFSGPLKSSMIAALSNAAELKVTTANDADDAGSFSFEVDELAEALGALPKAL